MKTNTIKANGIHYTPPELATFLASVTTEHLGRRRGGLQVLDPACGDGILLHSFALAVPRAVRNRLVLVGYDTNRDALSRARQLLSPLKVRDLILTEEDFLEAAAPVSRQRSFLEPRDERPPLEVDAVISNPPYVRTQVLGSTKAQALARRFGLTGRVDLYQAFVRAMSEVLRPGGVLGLLTSNRFLTIKSGASLRRLLTTRFDLRAIYDLGDTKLFSAAVLPVIVVAKKGRQDAPSICRFDRIYEHRSASNGRPIQTADSVLEAVRHQGSSGLVKTPAGLFKIERGLLSDVAENEVWSLTTKEYQTWLSVVERHRSHAFGDVSMIRVGIKTTADGVFIRDDWDRLPSSQQPEDALVRPLIRHVDAARWTWSRTHQYSVLYPHVMVNGKRRPVELEQFPRAKCYLESHRVRLSRRHYVIESGRRWYEIWVPHNPDDWARPKLVFPDISETPKCFFDLSGAIVNGDCYWMTLRPGFKREFLFLLLAVANSSFITRYYDIAFHNKLYAGRRRFMAQYVKRFPLPDLESKPSQQAIRCVARMVESSQVDRALEAEVDVLVWQSFGLVKEIGR